MTRTRFAGLPAILMRLCLCVTMVSAGGLARPSGSVVDPTTMSVHAGTRADQNSVHRSTSVTATGGVGGVGGGGGLSGTDPEKIYVLYKVPPFEATLTFPDPGYYNYLGQTALMNIDESLDAITSRYLFDFVYRYMEGMSRQHGRPLGQKLHSLEVRADLYEVDDQGNILAGPNVDGRRGRRALLRTAATTSIGSSGTVGNNVGTSNNHGGEGNRNNEQQRRRTSGYIPGARPSSNADQYENLPPKYIVAEFTGTASFEDYRYDPNDFDVVPGSTEINSEDDVVIDVDETVLRLMVGKALKQTNAYMQELWGATDHLVASVQEADLRMDLDLALSDVTSGGTSSTGSAGSTGSGQSDFYYGAAPTGTSNTGSGSNPGLDSSTPGVARPTSTGGDGAGSVPVGSTSFPEPTNDGLSTKETATIAVMSIFLAFFVGFIYMYMKREYRHGGGHGGPSKNSGGGGDDGDHATMNAALRRNHDGTLEFRDDWGADTVNGYGNDGTAYPIGTGGPPVSSRLYANPNSDQVMYGASYTPSETGKLQAHFSKRGVQKKKSKRNLTLVSPMMTVVEEEAPPPPPSRFSELPRSRNGHQLGATNQKNSGQVYDSSSNALMAALPQVSPSNIMQNVSSFFESWSPNAGEARNSQISPTGVESFIAPVPYKDFPRNDGTPCVMFDSDESSGWQVSAESREAAEREALTSMSVEVGVSGIRETTGSSVGRADEPIITEDGIENFVDKLEHLMKLKSRQYKERVKMEQERAQRKKSRNERRRREPEASRSPPKTSADPPALSNPQAPSIGSPPSSKHGEERKSLVEEGAQMIPLS